MGIVGQGKSTLWIFMVRDPGTFKTYTSMAPLRLVDASHQ